MKNIFLFFFIASNFIFCKIAKSEDYKRQDFKKKYSEIVELWKSGQRDTACVRMNRLKLKSIFQQDSVLVYATCCASGVFNFKLYNFDAAIFNYKKAVTVCDNNLFYRYKVYLRLASIYRLKGDFVQSHRFIDKCMSSAAEYKKYNLIMFSAYNEKYLLYLAEEKFDTALIYINKAISFLQENTPSSKEESLMNNKALIFIKSGDFNRAHEILNLCLNNTKNEYELNRTYLSLGELYLNEGNYSLSKKYLHKCLSFFKKKKNYLYTVNTLIFLSENYTSESEFVLARVSLAEARILSENINSLVVQKDIKKAYREIYIKKNDISALRQCDEELSLLMTKILLDDNKKLLAATRINYNELLAEKEFFINKNKKSYFFAEIFIIILVSLFIIFLLYLLRKYYQLYKIVLNREGSLLHHISCVHKEDALALKAIRLDVQTSLIELGSHIKKDLPYSSFSENVVSITNKLDKSVRKLELNALGNIDFYDAIQSIVGFYISSDEIIVNIKLEGNLVYIEYPVKLHFLNIISEFVDNTVKYSKADEIEILFQIEKSKLYFSYRDDGYGVDDFDAKKSKGILDVESRVKALGAQMDLKIEKYKGMFAEIKIE